MEELLSLKWNNHRSTFLHILSILRDKQLYTDATLACNGKFYSVHRLVLSTCSDYFSAMFDRTTTCKNPIIVLKDIKCEDLEALLDYMYLGEVNVRQTELASLIKAAECLQVKGLAVPDDEPPSSKRSKSDNSNVRRPSDGQISPASKRKKRSTIEAPLDRDSSSQSKSPQTQTRLPSDDPVNNDKEAVVNNDNDLPLETFVKVEKDDDILIEDDPQQFNPDGGGIKGEMDDGDPMNEIGGDSLDFLQSADEDYSQPYPGPSYQADLQNWQGDPPVSGADFTGMNFPSQSQDGSQNSTGALSSSSTTVTPSERTSQAQCPVCGKVFIGLYSKYNAKRHYYSLHIGERPFSCPHCSYRSSQKSHLLTHISRRHEASTAQWSTECSDNQPPN